MEKNSFGIATDAIESKKLLTKEFSDILKDCEELNKQLEALEGKPEPYTGPKVVVYSGTPNRYEQMERSAKMLLTNGSVDKIYFLIEEDTYPNKLPDIIEPVNIAGQKYFKKYSPNANTLWTHMALIRLGLHRIFPQYDRILWLDTDTLIVDDISGIFDTPLGNYYYYGAVRENRHYIQYLSIRKVERQEEYYQAYPQTEKQIYYNSGVLLENLKLLRESGMGDRIIGRINNFRSNFPDQNVINRFCRNRIYNLSCEYNWSFFTGDSEMPRIIHTSSGPIRPEHQALIDLYDGVSFDQVMDYYNREEFVYDQIKKQSKILEGDYIINSNQNDITHWNKGR